jgi:hypothetical protein
MCVVGFSGTCGVVCRPLIVNAAPPVSQDNLPGQIQSPVPILANSAACGRLQRIILGVFFVPRILSAISRSVRQMM